MNNNPTYKPSPLGNIPCDWEIKKLGNIGKIRMCKRVFNHETTDDGEIPFFKIGTFGKDPDAFISKELYDKYKKQFFFPKKGEILISAAGTLGRTVIYDGSPAYFQDSNIVWIANDESTVINPFLYYVFQIVKYKSEGGTIQRLYNSIISNAKFLSPPLPEQRAIAAVLSTWDNAIGKMQTLIAQKELRKKWLMQQLLTGKKRLPAFANASAGKKGFGGEWKECRIEDLFGRVTRKNIEGNTNVVTISAQRGFVKQTDFFNKSVASETLDNYFLVSKGEFCYNKSYSNGYPWGATKRLKDYDKAVVTTLYICFCIKDEKLAYGDFFEHYFEANLLDKGLTQIAYEGGRAHGLLNVTPSDFFKLKISIPQFDEQAAIAKVLQAADKEIELLKVKAEKLKEQKKGLMQVLLSGKKRLKINTNQI